MLHFVIWYKQSRVGELWDSSWAAARKALKTWASSHGYNYDDLEIDEA